MPSLQEHSTATALFTLKFWRVSESFISVDKISHIFGAKNDIDSVLLYSLKICFHEDHNYIDVAQTLHGGEIPCMIS